MEKIGKDRHLNVVGKEAKQVGGSISLTVKGDVIEVFKGNHSEQTTSDYYLKADNVVIEGATNVTIKVGGSSIAIGSDGIALKTDGTFKVESTGTMDLKSDAALTIKSSATAEVNSPATSVKADGNLTIKGGMTMIN
jgi:type VI secretion system secreted protein VgrG